MNCFYHPTRTAIGICKHCQRGLCSECAVLVDDTLACKDRHEEQVHLIDQLTQRSLLQSRRLRSGYLRNSIFYLLVGLLFLGFGWIEFRFLGLEAIFFMLIGVFLLYAALTNYLESKKFINPKK